MIKYLVLMVLSPLLKLIYMASSSVYRHSSLVSRPRTSNISLNPLVINLGSSVDKDLKAVLPPASTSIDKSPPVSQALVAVPPITAKPLAVVPFHRRSGHSAYVQRRMRRPFSVSEVEALVQAVEKLGTGRLVCLVLFARVDECLVVQRVYFLALQVA